MIAVPTPPAIDTPLHVREGYRLDELSGMLHRRGFEVVESRFCMYFFFRFVLENSEHFWPWCPRFLIRTLSHLDRILPIGPPMDLMLLARMVDHPAGAAGSNGQRA